MLSHYIDVYEKWEKATERINYFQKLYVAPVQAEVYGVYTVPWLLGRNSTKKEQMQSKVICTNKSPRQSKACNSLHTMQSYSQGSYQLCFWWITKQYIILWFDITKIQTPHNRGTFIIISSVLLIFRFFCCHFLATETRTPIWRDFITSSECLVCVYNLLTHLQVRLHILVFRALRYVQAESRGTWLL